MKDKVKYPVIVEEFNDEDGHYYVAISPNIKGLVTDGDTITELVEHIKDAIAGWLSGNEHPIVQDSTKWALKEHQRIMWVNVDLN